MVKLKNMLKLLNNFSFKNILALLVTIAWLYMNIHCISTTCEIDKDLLVNFNLIEALIIGYYFGSSYSSNKKDDLLKEANLQIGLKKCYEYE